MQSASTKTLPFSSHLNELRNRLLLILGFLLLGTIVGYFLHDHILILLVRPLDKPLYYSSPAGGLDFTLRLSFLFGLIASVPILVHQLLEFARPALPLNFKRRLKAVLLASCLLVFAGMAFAYFVSLPAALYFLDTFSNSDVHSLISTTEYFSFVSRYILGFSFLFQLPLVMLVINKIQVIPLKTLMHYQKWVVLSSFVVAAILTPTPDVFNQLLMAIPLILLYQVSVALIWLVNRRAKSTNIDIAQKLL